VVKTQQGFAALEVGLERWNWKQPDGEEKYRQSTAMFQICRLPDKTVGNAACQLHILDDLLLLQKTFFIYCFSRNDPLYFLQQNYVSCHHTTKIIIINGITIA
jgi:hypothetical protein